MLRYNQGGHSIWKPGKPGNVMKFQRTWKSYGKLMVFFHKVRENFEMLNLICLSSEKN